MRNILNLLALCMVCISCGDKKEIDELKLKDYERMACRSSANGWFDIHPPIIEDPGDPAQPKDENGDDWA